MGRILAIDYGKKRVGLAVTDNNKIIATGLTTVYAQEAINFLKAYIEKENVELFVVGHPKQNNNEESESMKYIKPFVKVLAKKIPNIPIEMYDERFTSVMAHKSMLENGSTKMQRRDKAVIDKISATILLTSYLEYMNIHPTK